MFWKYEANLQQHTFAKVWFQKSCKATLLKSYFSMGVLLWICSMFSKHLFIRTFLEGCFCILKSALKVLGFCKIFVNFPKFLGKLLLRRPFLLRFKVVVFLRTVLSDYFLKINFLEHLWIAISKNIFCEIWNNTILKLSSQTNIRRSFFLKSYFWKKTTSSS